MNGIGQEMVNFIKLQPTNTDYETKALLLRYTTQIAFKCSFSIEPRCFDINHNSEYFELIREVFAPSYSLSFKWISCVLLPKWFNDIFSLEYV